MKYLLLAMISLLSIGFISNSLAMNSALIDKIKTIDANQANKEFFQSEADKLCVDQCLTTLDRIIINNGKATVNYKPMAISFFDALRYGKFKNLTPFQKALFGTVDQFAKNNSLNLIRADKESQSESVVAKVEDLVKFEQEYCQKNPVQPPMLPIQQTSTTVTIKSESLVNKNSVLSFVAGVGLACAGFALKAWLGK